MLNASIRTHSSHSHRSLPELNGYKRAHVSSTALSSDSVFVTKAVMNRLVAVLAAATALEPIQRRTLLKGVPAAAALAAPAQQPTTL